MQQEQRKKPRYDNSAHESLAVRVRRTRGILRSIRGPLDATCRDFNCYGMRYESSDRQLVGEQVLLDLALGDRHITDIVALVCNALETEPGQFRHGVLFDFRANEHMRSDAVKSAIEWIEEALRDMLAESTVRQ